MQIKQLLDLSVVVSQALSQYLQLIQKGKHLKLGTANRDRLCSGRGSFEFFDQLGYPAWHRIARCFKELLQLGFRGCLQLVRVRISPQKTLGDLSIQPRKQTEHHRIITSQAGSKLVDQLGLKLDQPQPIGGQFSEFSAFFGVPHQRMQTMNLGSQDVGQYRSISGIILRSTGPKGFALFLDQLRIDSVHLFRDKLNSLLRESLTYQDVFRAYYEIINRGKFLSRELRNALKER